MVSCLPRRRARAQRSYGGSWKQVAEFTEIESGSRSERPKLAEAVKIAKRHKATLVIAKLDRLSRNVAFIANLMEAGVDFVAVDMPHANRLTIHILSAVAEHEREMISQRTRAALAAAKSRGVQLGNRSNLGIAQALSKAARIAQADKFADNILPGVLQIRAVGVRTRAFLLGTTPRSPPSFVPRRLARARLWCAC
jgi:DNA invertase Pin-like site-specific DNA recombinase